MRKIRPGCEALTMTDTYSQCFSHPSSCLVRKALCTDASRPCYLKVTSKHSLSPSFLRDNYECKNQLPRCVVCSPGTRRQSPTTPTGTYFSCVVVPDFGSRIPFLRRIVFQNDSITCFRNFLNFYACGAQRIIYCEVVECIPGHERVTI